MKESQNEHDDTKQFGSQHLDEALASFRNGLKSIGLFCSEEAIPVAEKGLKEGLDSLDGLLKKTREALDEAIEKAKSAFDTIDDNEPDTKKD